MNDCLLLLFPIQSKLVEGKQFVKASSIMRGSVLPTFHGTLISSRRYLPRLTRPSRQRCSSSPASMPPRRFYDLGCGDARWLCAIASTYRCKCVGVELVPEQIEAARRRATAAGVGDIVTIIEQDLRDVQLNGKRPSYSCTYSQKRLPR